MLKCSHNVKHDKLVGKCRMQVSVIIAVKENISFLYVLSLICLVIICKQIDIKSESDDLILRRFRK